MDPTAASTTPDAARLLLPAAAAGAAAWVAGCGLTPRAPALERLGIGLLAPAALAGATLIQPLAGASLLDTTAGRALPPVLLAALAWRGRRALLPPASWAAAAVVAAVVAVATAGALVADDQLVGDMRWHEGWLRQLAAGAPEPRAIYVDYPASYPWLWHALAAWALVLLPGGVTAALFVVWAYTLACVTAGTALLARELGLVGAAPGWAALLALGGAAAGPLTPPLAAGTANVPPAYPRDLGLALVPLALFAVARAARRRSRRWDATAGATLGLVALAAPVVALSAAAMVAALAVALRRRPPAALVAAAAAVAALWAAPLAWHASRLGGLAALDGGARSPGGPAEVAAALGALAVAAAGGLLVAVPAVRRPLAAVVAGALATVTAVAALHAAGVRGPASALTNPIRYVPAVSLALALPASPVLDRAARGRAVFLVAPVAAAAVLGPPIPAGHQWLGFLHDRERQVLACRLPPALRALDVVAVAAAAPKAEGRFALALFQLTGAGTLAHPRPRIRYRHAAAEADERRRALARMAAGGAPAAAVRWLAVRGRTVPAGSAPAGRCTFHRRRWTLAALGREPASARAPAAGAVSARAPTPARSHP